MEKEGEIAIYRIFSAIVLLVALCSACLHTKKVPAEISRLHPQVATMISLRSQSQASVMSQCITGKKFVKYLEAGKSNGKNKETYKVPPMLYAFADSAVWLISSSFRDATKDTSAFSLKSLVEVFGKPIADLPSVLDQPFRKYAYPRLGLAFSVNVEQGYYTIVDVFQPTSLKRYKRFFWNDSSQYPSRH
jgi:hypothetical protein